MRLRRSVFAALGAALALALVGVLVAFPAVAQPLPINVEILTPRSVFPDAVKAQVKIKLDGKATSVINMKDLSRTVTARITVQPGAIFPWHTHAGPVVVNVAQGQLVYVTAHDCVERPYDAGEAFVDPGHGHVHSAFNRTAGETVIYATFFQVAETGTLTLTEGITTPDCVLAP